MYYPAGQKFTQNRSISYSFRDIKTFSFSAKIKVAFYSEIPLPFPNSSYLLEPSTPMANAETRFLRLYNNYGPTGLKIYHYTIHQKVGEQHI